MFTTAFLFSVPPVLPSDKLQLYGQTLKYFCTSILECCYQNLVIWNDFSILMLLAQKLNVHSGCYTDVSIYGLADCKTIIKLYLSVVRPHLEYTSSPWDPHTVKDILALENVQKFMCKIATKQWSSDYQQLLKACAIPTLAERRTNSGYSTFTETQSNPPWR